ncbi:MAG: chemotaxis protein CheW [Gemmatimonadota bacterium]|nr:chemotaxis protein CheW [Gemmatimonadota bacterium]
MTRKRIRYSELSVPPAAPVSPVADEKPAAESVMPAEFVRAVESVKSVESLEAFEAFAPIESFESVELVSRDEAGNAFESFKAAEFLEPAESGTAGESLVAGQPPPRAKRNSTPVDLARTLTAERAAALAQDDEAAAVRGIEVYAQPIKPTAPDPRRTLREMARRRDGVMEMLMFRVGGERFAVELVVIDEVIDLPVIHHVPEMPPAMIGVVTVRGALTPVYSPTHALGLPIAHRDALLIFRRGDQRVGILIDDVDDAMDIDLSELRETVGGDASDSVLLGVVRHDSALIGIVDAHALIVAVQSADILETA